MKLQLQCYLFNMNGTKLNKTMNATKLMTQNENNPSEKELNTTMAKITHLETSAYWLNEIHKVCLIQ